MSDTFLNREEIHELTGRVQKELQIKALSKMGVPYYVNAIGRAVVVRSAIEGRVAAPSVKKAWVPRVLKSG
jgi:hypothetical protein